MEHYISTPLGKRVRVYTEEQVEAKVSAEREACAKIAAEWHFEGDIGEDIAAAIRERAGIISPVPGLVRH